MHALAYIDLDNGKDVLALESMGAARWCPDSEHAAESNERSHVCDDVDVTLIRWMLSLSSLERLAASASSSSCTCRRERLGQKLERSMWTSTAVLPQAQIRS